MEIDIHETIMPGSTLTVRTEWELKEKDRINCCDCCKDQVYGDYYQLISTVLETGIKTNHNIIFCISCYELARKF